MNIKEINDWGIKHKDRLIPTGIILAIMSFFMWLITAISCSDDKIISEVKTVPCLIENIEVSWGKSYVNFIDQERNVKVHYYVRYKYEYYLYLHLNTVYNVQRQQTGKNEFIYSLDP